jgi:predicted dienelactone hydrolase
LPVVVFSPGGGYVPEPTGYGPYGVAFARGGFLAVNLSHPEAPFASHCPALAIPADECDEDDLTIGEPSSGGTLVAIWYHRPLDARSVLDDLDGIAAAAGVTIDQDRIVMAGHSGGAYTTLAVAGLRVDFSSSVRGVELADPRPIAFYAASPQGVGHLGLTETSWDRIDRPVLTLTGRADATPDEPPPGRLHAFMHMPAPDKYLLYLDSDAATHELFALDAPSAEQMMLVRYIGSTASAFLDAYVRDAAEGRAWLASDAIERWSGGVATIMSR